MPGNIKVVKIILQVVGWLNIAAAAFSLIFYVVVVGIMGVRNSASALGGLMYMGPMVLVAVVGFGFGILSLVTASAIEAQRNWARVMSIVLAILMLLSFPIGTALGVLILVFIYTPEAKAWFGDRTA